MSNLFSKLLGFGKSGLWHQKVNEVVGIDFGTSSVKAVQLKKDKGRILLETYGEIALGPYNNLAVSQVSNLGSEKMSQLLADLFNEANITTRVGSLAIPLRSSLVNMMSLPDLAADKLEKIIPIEARKYIPVPISEVELDWWIIPKKIFNQAGEEHRRTVEVLVVAIHKDTIKQYEEIVKLAEFQPAFFEIETFSAIRAVFAGEMQAVVMLDIGAATSKLSIIDYGVVRQSHTIGKGSQDITLAISRSLGVDFAKAEEIKRRVGLVESVGLPSTATGEDAQIRNTVSTIVEYIFSEANKVISAYQNRERRVVTKVVIIGGGGLLKGLLDLAKTNFEATVVLGEAFAKVEYPAFLDKVLKETGPGFAVATGLALRHLEELG